MEFSEEQVKEFIEGIYSGEITVNSLPENLYFAIADYLIKGLETGFDDVAVEWGSAAPDLIQELKDNIYMFSGAKTYQQVREITDLLYNDEGLRSFKEFFADAKQVYDKYNKVWAQTEYDTAIGQAQCAVKWSRIEQDKEVLPYLKYSAVIDANTSDICRPLNGIVLPVGDPAWSKIAPLNHFNCRCLLLQVTEGPDKANAETKAKINGVLGEMDDTFKMNPGKDGYVFGPKHPYFEVAPKDKELAKENFNLPVE